MTSATPTAQPDPMSGFAKTWHAFSNWRRTRPFWGGLLVLLAAGPILYFPYATLSLGNLRIQMATTAGAGSAVIGLLLIALGISCWFQPMIRIFAGIAAIVLSIISLPVSNFGGFGMGVILGILGGALVCSWAPLKVTPAVAEGTAESAAAESATAESATAESTAVEAGTQEVLPTPQPGEAGAAAQPTAWPQAQQPQPQQPWQPQEPQEENKSVE